MPVTPYADADALAAWPCTAAPSDAVALLRSATIVIARAAQRDPYVDTPTVTDAAVLADATCAQVAWWVANKIDPSARLAGGPTPVKSSKILTAEVTYDTTSQGKPDDSHWIRDPDIAPEAWDILRVSGLLWVPLPQYDTQDCLPTWGLDSPSRTASWLIR